MYESLQLCHICLKILRNLPITVNEFYGNVSQHHFIKSLGKRMLLIQDINLFSKYT